MAADGRQRLHVDFVAQPSSHKDGDGAHACKHYNRKSRQARFFQDDSGTGRGITSTPHIPSIPLLAGEMAIFALRACVIGAFANVSIHHVSAKWIVDRSHQSKAIHTPINQIESRRSSQRMKRRGNGDSCRFTLLCCFSGKDEFFLHRSFE